MNEQAIQEQYQHIVTLLKQQRLKEAQSQLEAFLWNSGDWTLRNRLEQAQTSYQYMLQYMRQGIDDPERQKLYRQILTETWEVADQARLSLLDGVSTHYYHSLRNNRERLPKEYNIAALQKVLESFPDDLAVCQLMPDNQGLDALLQRPEPHRRPCRASAQPGCPLCAALGPRPQTQKESTEREYIVENWNKEKVTPKKKAGLLQRLLSLAAAAALALSLVGCGTSAVVPGGSADVVPNPSSTAASVDAPFEMHFIDVGQALSVLVECDGQFMLYDGGNVDDGSLVVSYLQKQGVEELQYVFCSHAHEDHVGGLAAALAYFPANHVYSPVTEASTKCFRDFVKYTQQQGLQVEVPAVGTTWPLGSAAVTMLGPVAQYSDTNDTSIVLRIDYGSTSFLLTGDMEKTAESDLVASGANLKADVLQVGHHGSSTSTGYVFLNAVLPKMGIISCGVNNKYGHPHEETLSILRDAGVDVYRTDLLGTITIGSDGQNYTVGTEHFAADAELNPTDPAAASTVQQAYIGNVNSKKFHLPTCPNLPAEKNQILFSSYDEAIAAGYTPCSTCIK